MKTYLHYAIVLAVAIFLSTSLHAQYSFKYDESGNRTEINIVKLKSSTILQDSTIADTGPVPVDSTAGFLDDKILSGVRIYPNPTAGRLLVEINPEYSFLNAKIVVYSGSGTRILTLDQVGPSNRIDLIHHPAGIYYMKIYLGGKITTWKIIKQ